MHGRLAPKIGRIVHLQVAGLNNKIHPLQKGQKIEKLVEEEKRCSFAEETVRFVDGAFGQLDLSGSAELTTPIDETSEKQDRHGSTE